MISSPNFTQVPTRQRGFTLIELMITVVIVGVLAAVAIPAYKSFVAKGNRGAVQSHMLAWATSESQYLADARAYADKAQLEKMVPTPAAVSSKYTLAVEVGETPPSFTITATPIAGSTQAGEPVLTINHTGVRTPADKW